MSTFGHFSLTPQVSKSSYTNQCQPKTLAFLSFLFASPKNLRFFLLHRFPTFAPRLQMGAQFFRLPRAKVWICISVLPDLKSWKAAALRSMVPTHQLVGMVVLSPLENRVLWHHPTGGWEWDFFFHPQILPLIGLK